jgi:hypothetical protein
VLPVLQLLRLQTMVVGLAAAVMSNTQDRGLGIALAESLELFQ